MIALGYTKGMGVDADLCPNGVTDATVANLGVSYRPAASADWVKASSAE